MKVDRTTNRLTDAPGVDQSTGGLMRGAEECVGRAADPQALGARRLHHRTRLGEGRRQRLFRVDMLAGRYDLVADFCVYHGQREIDHELDFRIGEQPIDGDSLNPERLRLGLRGLHADVRYRFDFDELRSRRHPSDMSR